MAADPREPYGRLVHEQRLAFNAEKERPFVLLPWEDRDEHQRELDMAIGAAVAAAERERIRQLAIGYGAVYGGIKDGTPSLMHSFADVIGEPEERSDEKEAGDG